MREGFSGREDRGRGVGTSNGGTRTVCSLVLLKREMFYWVFIGKSLERPGLLSLKTLDAMLKS
jgi:hypothetical protein